MRRDLYRLRRRTDHPKFAEEYAASSRQREQRQQAADRLNGSLTAGLPVSEVGDDLVAAVRANPVVIVAGETGSGKTTQLPKVCLKAGLGVGGMIGHTQPRRIAARSVAQRIAEEVGSEIGQQVGYAIRFSDQTAENTLVKVMTDGLLLTEIRHDPYLNAYDAIIVDEAHERSLNVDFLMGYLKQLLAKRSDLKVIITSATIDVDRFAEYFSGAPVIKVGGRTFPVEVHYQPAEEDSLSVMASTIREIDATPLTAARDILVFFSGEREIFEANHYLRREFAERFEVLPLYARLSANDQRRVFEPSSRRRRIVLATNVAETSLTVPNIGFVIDPGFARISRYSYRSKLQRLPIEPISQASADQRKGRCGRIAPGVCYRLYSETDFLSRPAYTDAEIRRVNLASVVLQMQAFRLGDINRFPFIDPPEPRAIRDAFRLLDELAALRGGKLTKIGQQMARLPVDPRLARMLITSADLGCLNELLIIVSGLAVQDPRERPSEKTAAADTAHERFLDERSDFLSLLNLWKWIEEQREELTRNRWQRLLSKQFVSPQRVREWRELHRQLRLSCRDLGLRENQEAGSYERIHESILSGSLSQIAWHEEHGNYLGARNLRLNIFPGSGLAKKKPKWMVAAEVVETRRVFARCVAQVEASWIERQAQHLLKHRFSEPVWSAKRGEVIAYETITLYGLVLADRRPVAYSRIDPKHCRDLFIRDGLIAGATPYLPDFLQHNLEAVRRVQDMEAKGRRRDLLVSDDHIYQFYADRLPAELCRSTDLRKWLRRASAAAKNSLWMREEELLKTASIALTQTDFPNEIQLQGVALELKYRFAPGEKDDGITALVPVGLLSGISGEALQWSVPGLFPAVIEQWLRSLPKTKRRTLAPLADKVDEICTVLTKPGTYRQGRLLAAMGQLLSDRFNVAVTASDWDAARVDEHLLVNVRVIDEADKVIGEGRWLDQLKQQFAQTANTKKTADTSYEQRGLSTFPELEIASHMVLGERANAQIAYPGFADNGTSVDLKLFDTPSSRDAAHRLGLIRLALLHLGKAAQYFRKEMAKEVKMGLHFAALGNADELREQLLGNVVWYCYFSGESLPADSGAFETVMQARRGDLADVFQETLAEFKSVLQLRFDIVRAMDGLAGSAYGPSLVDVREQLEFLVPKNFLHQTPWRFLPLLSRYLEGLLWRLTQLVGHVPRDRQLMQVLRPLEARLQTLAKSELCEQEEWMDLKFYLQEFRLKTFAENVAKRKVQGRNPELLSWKVSPKRVAEKLREVELRVGLA